MSVPIRWPQTLAGFLLTLTFGACATTPAPSKASSEQSTASAEAGAAQTCPIAGDLLLKTADDLAQFSTRNCATSQGDLVVEDTLLTDLKGIEALAYVQGTVWIVDNPALRDLGALGGLREVGKNLSIVANPALGRIELGALTKIGGSLWIGENLGLVELAPFISLKKIGGEVRISQNAALAADDTRSALEALVSSPSHALD